MGLRRGAPRLRRVGRFVDWRLVAVGGQERLGGVAVREGGEGQEGEGAREAQRGSEGLSRQLSQIRTQRDGGQDGGAAEQNQLAVPVRRPCAARASLGAQRQLLQGGGGLPAPWREGQVRGMRGAVLCVLLWERETNGLVPGQAMGQRDQVRVFQQATLGSVFKYLQIERAPLSSPAPRSGP